ncbi:TlpA family protein disulfide reductase [Helicobacter mesocricetorum]|uniref:TlpA family protein disulfide reductase n=1 Tax=Helicobacter mesocricetorum TaxID=87012 RepID=UPI000CF119AD|nr:TlpA disulfide reductase family protein [Helicobacter mesocricetorum]
MKLLTLTLSILLLFIACDDTKISNISPTDKIKATNPEKLTLEDTQKGKLTIQHIIKNSGNFKNIDPKEEEILKNLIVTSETKNIKILFFFTTWCEPCEGIIPHLENLRQQFNEAITIYGISVDDFVENSDNFKQVLEAFAQQNNIQFPMIVDSNRFKFLEMLNGIEGVPLLALYDENGSYIIHYLGAAPEEMIEFDILQRLEKR